MATMDPMGLVMNLLPQAQQSFQNSMRSAKRSFNNTDGNFWQKLGAGAMGYLDEVFTGKHSCRGFMRMYGSRCTADVPVHMPCHPGRYPDGIGDGAADSIDEYTECSEGIFDAEYR